MREAALKFLPAGRVQSTTPLEAAAERADREASPETLRPDDGELYYVCPMPEHVDILCETPGKCPLCGMTLVPVRRHEGHVDEPRIRYWTCPMPEHASVRESASGKCPICSMSLIPVTERRAVEKGESMPEDDGHTHAGERAPARREPATGAE